MNHTFPAEAGTHLPTPEGWKAELALGGWLVTYWNRCPARGIEPDTVTHLSTNRVRRRLTSLIKANVLTTTPDHQRSNVFRSPDIQSVDALRRVYVIALYTSTFTYLHTYLHSWTVWKELGGLLRGRECRVHQQVTPNRHQATAKGKTKRKFVL